MRLVTQAKSKGKPLLIACWKLQRKAPLLVKCSEWKLIRASGLAWNFFFLHILLWCIWEAFLWRWESSHMPGFIMTMMYSRLGWPCLFIDAQSTVQGAAWRLQFCAAKLGACKGGAGQETLMWCSPKAVGESKFLRVFCEQRGSCTQAAFWQLSWAHWVQMHTEGRAVQGAVGRSSAQAGLVDGYQCWDPQHGKNDVQNPMYQKAN